MSREDRREKYPEVSGAEEVVVKKKKKKKKKTGKANPRYKTVLCRRWKRNPGHCPQGDECTFAHGLEELRVPDAVERKSPKGAATPLVPPGLSPMLLYPERQQNHQQQQQQQLAPLAYSQVVQQQQHQQPTHYQQQQRAVLSFETPASAPPSAAPAPYLFLGGANSPVAAPPDTPPPGFEQALFSPLIQLPTDNGTSRSRILDIIGQPQEQEPITSQDLSNFQFFG